MDTNKSWYCDWKCARGCGKELSRRFRFRPRHHTNSRPQSAIVCSMEISNKLSVKQNRKLFLLFFTRSLARSLVFVCSFKFCALLGLLGWHVVRFWLVLFVEFFFSLTLSFFFYFFLSVFRCNYKEQLSFLSGRVNRTEQKQAAVFHLLLYLCFAMIPCTHTLSLCLSCP